jgi:hypothetical protein
VAVWLCGMMQAISAILYIIYHQIAILSNKNKLKDESLGLLDANYQIPDADELSTTVHLCTSQDQTIKTIVIFGMLNNSMQPGEAIHIIYLYV